MGDVGKKLRRASGGGRTQLLHWCPGCKQPHGITIFGGAPVWSFNNDYERPSFSPSVLYFTDYDEEGEKRGGRRTLCHYFIRTGAELAGRGANLDPMKSYIDFCGDSPHELRGKIVELPDWPYAPGTYGGIDEQDLLDG